MMSNIKYRQYVGGKFHYWGFLQDDFTEKLCFVGPITNQMANPIHCQFTGLTDKNGVEIYEGDIVEYPHSNKRKGKVRSEVIFDQCGFTVAVNNSIFNDYAVLMACVVIGNIYQNPELLK